MGIPIQVRRRPILRWTPGRHQAINWCNVDILAMRCLGTNFYGIVIKYIFFQENTMDNVVCNTWAILLRPQCVEEHFQPYCCQLAAYWSGQECDKSIYIYRIANTYGKLWQINICMYDWHRQKWWNLESSWLENNFVIKGCWSVAQFENNNTVSTDIQWNLSVTTTSIIKFITCDLFSNVF